MMRMGLPSAFSVFTNSWSDPLGPGSYTACVRMSSVPGGTPSSAFSPPSMTIPKNDMACASCVAKDGQRMNGAAVLRVVGFGEAAVVWR